MTETEESKLNVGSSPKGIHIGKQEDITQKQTNHVRVSH